MGGLRGSRPDRVVGGTVKEGGGDSNLSREGTMLSNRAEVGRGEDDSWGDNIGGLGVT